MLRIRDILVRIRIRDPYLWLTDPDPTPEMAPDIFVSDLQEDNILVRIRIRDPYLWLPDPDPGPEMAPGIFVSDLQDDNIFFKVFLLTTFEATIYIIFQR